MVGVFSDPVLGFQCDVREEGWRSQAVSDDIDKHETRFNASRRLELPADRTIGTGELRKGVFVNAASLSQGSRHFTRRLSIATNDGL